MFDVLDLVCPVDKQYNLDNVISLSKKGLSDDLKAVFVALDYKNDDVARLILNVKNGRQFALIPDLGSIVVSKLLDFSLKVSQDTSYYNDNLPQLVELISDVFDPRIRTFITFVPSDPVRTLKRGFHFPQLLCSDITTRLNAIADNKKVFDTCSLLVKPKTTQAQSTLDRKNRLTNLKNQFQIIDNPRYNLANYDAVIIIDDLTTTGATISESATTIKSSHPFLKIYGIAVASN